MTPEVERISKIIVEKGQGKCWHEMAHYDTDYHGDWTELTRCKKCGFESGSEFIEDALNVNPDMTSPSQFIELLKVAEKYRIIITFYITNIDNHIGYHDYYVNSIGHQTNDIDKLPLLLATEIAKILEGK